MGALEHYEQMPATLNYLIYACSHIIQSDFLNIKLPPDGNLSLQNQYAASK